MRSSAAEAMAAAVHDVRSSVGSIRLALTSVLDDDEDADFRRSMLSGAEEESRRLNAALTALPALVGAMTDDTEPEVVDLVSALQNAVAEAARRQVSVHVDADGPVPVLARTSSLSDVLAALCVLVADSGGDVLASATDNRVRVTRADGGAVRWDRALVQHLGQGVGAEVAGDSVSVELVFPRR